MSASHGNVMKFIICLKPFYFVNTLNCFFYFAAKFYCIQHIGLERPVRRSRKRSYDKDVAQLAADESDEDYMYGETGTLNTWGPRKYPLCILITMLLPHV